ncbi:MAG: type II toxin-antitoxin system HicB family antitoxin [Deltaproteobacteria bacterium]|nr:type II toxin-antitoxin system HicB family antitoxin [Deltaproteobacteria bacterium]
MRYLIVFEKTATGYSAYLPDVPGCVATGENRDDVEKNIREALDLHLEGLREDGVEPEPAESFADYLEIGAVPR